MCPFTSYSNIVFFFYFYHMQITGIILAGGKSNRMGTDKSLLEINGKTLLQRAIDICLPVCKTILISSNNTVHEEFGFKIIPDEIQNCGPIGGIYSSLKKSETEWNIVLSVDAAFVEQEFIQYLISEIDACDAIIPIHEKGKEPLIALYHKNSLEAIKKMHDSGNYKMHNLLNEINTKYVNSQNWVEQFPKIFRNLNRPEDF